MKNQRAALPLILFIEEEFHFVRFSRRFYFVGRRKKTEKQRKRKRVICNPDRQAQFFPFNRTIETQCTSRSLVGSPCVSLSVCLACQSGPSSYLSFTFATILQRGIQIDLHTIIFTRGMHSSRMLTATSLPYGGSHKYPPGQRPPWTDTPLNRALPDRHPSGQTPRRETPGQTPLWTETPSEATNVLRTCVSNQTTSRRHITIWRYNTVFVHRNGQWNIS